MQCMHWTIRHITEKSEPVAYKLNASILQALVHFRPLKGLKGACTVGELKD